MRKALAEEKRRDVSESSQAPVRHRSITSSRAESSPAPYDPDMRWALMALAGLLTAAAAGAQGGGWQRAAPVPLPRTEVAAAALGGEIVVVGGFTANGRNSTAAEAYAPRQNRWRDFPDLPTFVDHAAAASHRGRLYVVGGYGADRRPLRRAFVYFGGRWRSLPRMPGPRAAAGAAIAAGRLFVVGGVGVGGLARDAFSYDLAGRRWSRIPGPTRREHLAATAANGQVYALGGRLAGIDSNLDAFEVYSPRTRRWRRLPPIPDARGGTAAAAVGARIVSVGGEEPGGTIESVYSFNRRSRRWTRLPDLPTPRHGLGAVALNGRVYAVAGGYEPGLTVSGANEFLTLAR